ncbi:hypothetical protein AMATHDRAFT_50897 [Amanita thiersii Skay4041]|uniref:non-specific serine/threonine protein kinase n=1 Tax=Amanita thiersii Skay4041 TaxID=703135 RepID=A0A2A9N7U7_9AGAR|nr:hypothetical protein AMATHDRAFT_50897 [Amanita thiersii Skay4041]
MAHKKPCAKYQYVVTPAGPKILPVQEPSCKDEESPADYNAGGYLPVKVNDTFKAGRYRVIRKLGWGHFSTVWLVKDAHEQRHSALKVVKSAGRYAETARDEIKLLSSLQSFSPTHPGRSHIVSFLDSFTHQGPESTHICIVFEPLGENLLALIERHKKKGVPRALVRVIAKQILFGLEYLHDECDLVHTDIKPENILISIPDIENHIQTELSQSPSPTSRRVGVPLPTKSRAGVTIPHLHHRTRRQVQIFDSQPLASPTRSFGRSGYFSSCTNTRPGGSGSNSVSGSYTLASHATTAPADAHTSVTGVSSNVLKVPSNLSTSAPINNPLHLTTLHGPETEIINGNKGEQTVPSVPQVNADSSPSTLSSSSSIASIVASTAAGSSNISTPPTSVSQSLVLGGELSARMKLGDESLLYFCTSQGINSRIDPHHALPIIVKGKMRAEHESLPDNDMSMSFQGKNTETSMKNSQLKMDSRESASSCASKLNVSANPPPPDSSRQAHTRSHSGVSVSGFWKDPGTGAPAPAVVISAVVGIVGAEGDCLQLSNTSIQGESEQSATSRSSGNSSATVTGAHPSPQRGAPIKAKTASLLSGVHKIITSNLFSHDVGSTGKSNPKGEADNGPKLTQPVGPSLLTRTAPPRASTSSTSDGDHISSATPHQQPSHSLTHIHPRRTSSCKCMDPEHKHRTATNESRLTTKARGQTRVTSHPHNHHATASTMSHSSSSVTPKPTSSPRAPPPSPCETFLVKRMASPGNCIHADEDDTTDNVAPESWPSQASIVTLPQPPINIKIADLGNATPSTKHFTEDIQTRQYRAPEAILGRRDWDARADIWSVACLIFELLTAEYLFDPQGQGELFTKDDDHMAQIIELMGDFPLEVKMGGKYSRELFDHTGALRYIRTLKPWPLKRVMVEKYLYTEPDSVALCEFLEPMLAVDMRERICARVMKNHQWLEPIEFDELVINW